MYEKTDSSSKEMATRLLLCQVYNVQYMLVLCKVSSKKVYILFTYFITLKLYSMLQVTELLYLTKGNGYRSTSLQNEMAADYVNNQMAVLKLTWILKYYKHVMLSFSFEKCAYK